MSVIGSNILAGASGQGGYFIDRSVRLRSSASAYFNRTPASAGNRKTWTWSGWVKRGTLGGAAQILMGAAITAGSTEEQLLFGFPNTDGLAYRDGATGNFTVLPSVLRDPSAWYHIIFAYDSANATQADRGIFYINGVRQTATTNAIALNRDSFINSTAAQALGRYGTIASNYFDGYLTEINFIDGQALTPSDFGEYDAITGVWKPKKYVGTYGTNGFYLNFSDNTSTTTLAYDYSGNGNNWTANNISLTSGATYDSMTDVPTLTSETAANYCTLNPLNKAPSDVSISSGNLEASSSFTSDHRCFASTFQITSGKWYWEVQYATGTISIGSNIVGVFNLPTPDTANNRRPADSINNGIGIRQDGQYESDNTSAAYFGSSISVGDVIGVALDADAGTVKFNVNGGSFGSTLTFVSAGGVYTPGGDIRASSGTPKTIHNFGQRPFAYTPPTGFKALNTFNLPDSTIVDGSQYFAVNTYAGTGTTNVQTVGFAPDFVWIKSRTNAYWHKLFDKIRGANKPLVSNDTTGELTETQGLMSFDSNGFTLGTSSDSTVNNSGSGQTYVGWSWKAGGTAVSNTDGSITSSVSANTTSGFSVVTWTNPSSGTPTIGHGLGVAPTFIIVKDRTYAYNWDVGCTSIGWANRLNLNATSATSSGFWNSTAPTSAVFTYAANGANSGDSMVAYCFAEVPGFSKFGSYTGNGSTDGPFVFCGFRPKFVLVKGSSNVSSWQLFDTSRNTYNAVDNTLWADLSSAEGTGYARVDLLSNGFKVRAGSGADPNVSGATYIFMALSENPFKNSLAR